MKTVLIIDDSAYERSILKLLFESVGYEVVGHVSTGEAGIDIAMETEPDIITVDNLLPDIMGVDLIKEFKKNGIQSKIIMISGVDMQHEIDKAMESGADEYLIKPYKRADLMSIIEGVIGNE